MKATRAKKQTEQAASAGLLSQPEMSERVVHILSEAAALFAERGYERTSMRDLAERCAVSKSLLYHHFADKEAIYDRITIGFGHELFDFVAGRIPAAGPASDRVLAFMTASAEFFERYRLVWLASTTAFWSDPSVRRNDERLAVRKQYERLLRRLLSEGVASGDFAEVDVAMAGRLILSALNWLPRWYQPGRGEDAVSIARAYHRMILGGLGRPSQRAAPRVATPRKSRASAAAVGK